MNIFIKVSLIVVAVLLLAYALSSILTPAAGWYGYKKWENRMFSKDINDSKERHVFIKSLDFKIYYDDTLVGFVPFIERGFRYGLHSMKETRLLLNSAFPYQLGFNWQPKPGVTVLIKPEELAKFDSANVSWGFLKNPTLRDTITLLIFDSDTTANPHGYIKVWD